ncbi:hypothetical protein [Limosilactobacillus urinaemulieris]|uniref:hypothetical protein n=1 Tax=Limosilactobacillus urinaemulieris TaxID=2742600 RepID=UPI0028EEEF22|nr:hypothetical protein [Limosilactobacillus urinaemulieris]
MTDNNNQNNSSIVPPNDDTPYLSAIVNQFGTDTDEPNVQGLGYSPDNGVHFYVNDTIKGRKYRQEDADRLWPYLKKYIGGSSGTVTGSIKWADILDKPNLVTEDELNQRLLGISTGNNVVNWNEIQNKPDLVTKNDLDNRLSHQATTIAWSQITDKPDLATKHELDDLQASIGTTSGGATINTDILNANDDDKTPDKYKDGFTYEMRYASKIGITMSDYVLNPPTVIVGLLTTKTYKLSAMQLAHQTYEVAATNEPYVFMRTGTTTKTSDKAISKWTDWVLVKTSNKLSDADRFGGTINS